MEQDGLTKQLAKTNELLKKENSPGYQFFLSIVRGIGTAIGITIIGGILIGVLDRVVYSVYDIPIINKIIHTSPFIERYNR